MRIAMTAYMDAGFACGIDDEPFRQNAERLEKNGWFGLALRKSAGAGDSLFAEDPDFGMESPFGKGIAFDLAGDWFLGAWRRGAVTVAAHPAFAADFSLDAGQAAGVGSLFGLGLHADCGCELRSNGITVLDIEINGFPDGIESAAAVRYLQAWEYAAYGSYGSDNSFVRLLGERLASVLSESATDGRIPAVSRRTSEGQQAAIPGFSLLFHPDTESDYANLRSYREDQGDEFTDLLLDGSKIAGSWYVFIVRDRKTAGVEDRLLSARHASRLVGIYSMFFGLCDGHQRLLDRCVSSHLGGRRAGESSLAGTGALITLKTLSQVFITRTDIATLTQNQEIAALLNMLDREGRLDRRHAAIARTVEVLSSIQNQAEEEESAQREKKVNIFISVITSLTFVSVIADFLNIDSLAREILPGAAARGGLYAGILLLFALLFRAVFRE